MHAAVEHTMSVGVSFIGGIAIALGAFIWSAIEGVPLWIQCLLALVAFSLATIGFLGGALLFRFVSEQLTRQLRIQYDPRTNFVPDTPENGAQARIIVRNTKSTPVNNLHVVIESLVSKTNVRKAAEYAPQFSNMPLHIERGTQGMTLQGYATVEIWVAQHVRKDEWLWFLSSEDRGPYKVPVGEYELRVRTTADGLPRATGRFVVIATKAGTLQFSRLES